MPFLSIKEERNSLFDLESLDVVGAIENVKYFEVDHFTSSLIIEHHYQLFLNKDQLDF